MTTIAPKLLFQNAIRELEGIYGDRESQSIIFMLMAHLYQYSRMDVLMDKPLDNFNQLQWDIAIQKLKLQVPIQYVIGAAWFLDREFMVNAAVLIPRLETEELVNLIIQDHDKNQAINILDLGTGSGCIAISLKLAFPNAIVYALDISGEALQVAKQNAKNLGAEILFIQDDMRNITEELPLFDVIVSNPPYVTAAEKSLMNVNVLEHEPHVALFVEDNHPLEFYEAIAIFGQKKMKSTSKIYLEINEHFGPETKSMLYDLGYENIELSKDIHEKDRMVKASFSV
jgi:release factor glutamine methyltransferase